jgi:hypothetical protein
VSVRRIVIRGAIGLEFRFRGNDPPEADRESEICVRNSLESVFDNEGLRESGVRG